MEMRSNMDIKVGNTEFQQVKQFFYLESTIMQDNIKTYFLKHFQ